MTLKGSQAPPGGSRPFASREWFSRWQPTGVSVTKTQNAFREFSGVPQGAAARSLGTARLTVLSTHRARVQRRVPELGQRGGTGASRFAGEETEAQGSYLAQGAENWEVVDLNAGGPHCALGCSNEAFPEGVGETGFGSGLCFLSGW